MISIKIVSVLILAACLTLWELLFRQQYFDWVTSTGGVVGFGEVFVGYVMVGFVATFVTWILIRRLRNVG